MSADHAGTFLAALDPSRTDMVEHASFVATVAHGPLSVSERLLAIAHTLESVCDHLWRPDMNAKQIFLLDDLAHELRDIAVRAVDSRAPDGGVADDATTTDGGPQ